MQIKKHIARNSQREERQARLPGQAGLEIILEILFFSVIFLGMSFMVAEGEENPTPEDQSYDSIRRYGALENKISYLSYLGMLESIESAKEEIEESKEETEYVPERAEPILERYKYSKQMIKETMAEIEGKDGVGSFLLGKRLGTLRFQLVQIKDQFRELKTLSRETANYPGGVELEAKIAEIEKEINKVENFILTEEEKFSLFGWFVSIL